MTQAPVFASLTSGDVQAGALSEGATAMGASAIAGSTGLAENPGLGARIEPADAAARSERT